MAECEKVRDDSLGHRLFLTTVCIDTGYRFRVLYLCFFDDRFSGEGRVALLLVIQRLLSESD